MGCGGSKPQGAPPSSSVIPARLRTARYIDLQKWGIFSTEAGLQAVVDRNKDIRDLGEWVDQLTILYKCSNTPKPPDIRGYLLVNHYDDPTTGGRMAYRLVYATYCRDAPPPSAPPEYEELLK